MPNSSGPRNLKSTSVPTSLRRPPSQPLLMSGKKGVPRILHELSPLPRIGSFRRLSAQRDYQFGGTNAVVAALLPLRALPSRHLALGRNLAPFAGAVDARGPRGRVLAWDLE